MPGGTSRPWLVLVAEASAPGLYGEATSVTEALTIVVTVLFWSIAVDALAYRSPRLAAL